MLKHGAAFILRNAHRGAESVCGAFEHRIGVTRAQSVWTLPTVNREGAALNEKGLWEMVRLLSPCVVQAKARRGIRGIGHAASLLGMLLVIALVPMDARAADGLHYEQVSVADKNSYDVLALGIRATDVAGGKVAYAVGGPVPGTAAGTQFSWLVASRGDSGWSSTLLTPPVPVLGTLEAKDFGPTLLSADLSRNVTTWNAALTSSSPAEQTTNVFVREFDGTYTLISPNTPPGTVSDGRWPRVAGADASLSHVVYETDVPQAAGGVAGIAYPYEWANEEVRLVGVLPDPDGPGPLTAEPAPYGARVGSGEFGRLQHAVSADGARVFFHAVEPTVEPAGSLDGQLYVRKAGSATDHVSASHRTDCAGDATCGGDDKADPSPDPLGPLPAFYWNAEAVHGHRVLFSSCERLTDDSGAAPAPSSGECGAKTTSDSGEVKVDSNDDLYIYDVETGALTDITPLPSGGGVFGVIGASEDLSRIYFVAAGVLTDPSPAGAPVDGAPNLYLWDHGQTKFIATMAATASNDVQGSDVLDSDSWSRTDGDRVQGARVADDGSSVMFVSRAPLTGVDNTSSGCPVSRCAEAFIYDADSGKLLCVSCPNAAPTGDATLYTDRLVSGAADLPRNLSSDGTRAYFQTPDDLVSKDVNGKIDVYRWDETGIQLISDGKASEHAFFVDANPSGDQVFIRTRSPLVASDRDALIDLYVARAGVGFAEESPAPDCSGEDCLGEPNGTPKLIDPLTPTISGDESVGAGGRRGSVSVGRLTHRQQVALAKGKAVPIRVRATGGGRVAAVGRASLGGRSRVVLHSTKVFHRSVGVLMVRLSAAARRYLVSHGRVKVTVTVRAAHSLTPEMFSLRLTQAVTRSDS